LEEEDLLRVKGQMAISNLPSTYDEGRIAIHKLAKLHSNLVDNLLHFSNGEITQ
jgi:hypothetical protein